VKEKMSDIFEGGEFDLMGEINAVVVQQLVNEVYALSNRILELRQSFLDLESRVLFLESVNPEADTDNGDDI